VNGSRETKLIQMSNGSDTILDTGTEYDMTQKQMLWRGLEDQ